MARYSIEDTTLTNIADAIRSKTGKTDGIVVGEMANEISGIEAGGSDPFEMPFTYTVDAISGARYGFAENSNGYYESQNKGVSSSYAICRVNFTATNACDIVFDVINYAESSYDYAIFGKIDTALSLSYSADSVYQKSFKGLQSASIVEVVYSGVTVGNHYIDIKFIKDSSGNSYNDSVQFKIRHNLPQEIINKILAADSDLKAENIREGVDVFGILGTHKNPFPNGTEWTRSNSNITSCYPVYNANGIWVACSRAGTGLYYSTDGKTWTQSNVTRGDFYTVYNANGIWIAGSYNNVGLYYSTDGKYWTQSNVTSGYFYSVYNANGIWVAGNYSGNLYYSVTWEPSN